MIGNDIVDLSLAQIQSNWKRRGFLDKIFTPREKSLILQAADPELMVWDLWSRKEAAYKIYNRQTRIRAYIPLELECFDTDCEIGRVIFGKRTYFTKTEITENYIHTIAVTEKSDFGNIAELDNAIQIVKIAGLPFAETDRRIVSVSHHGEYRRVVTLV